MCAIVRSLASVHENERHNEVEDDHPREVNSNDDEPILRADSDGDMDPEGLPEMNDDQGGGPLEPVKVSHLLEALEDGDLFPLTPGTNARSPWRPARVRVLPRPITPTCQQQEDPQLN